jgi:hypothetical protein
LTRTCSASEDERDGGLSGPAETEGFIVAYVQGWNDNTNNPGYGTWNSWNGAGTVNSTTAKPGCYKWGGQTSYCYSSCGDRDSGAWKGCDANGCDWTTCYSSDSFNTAVLDLLEEELCVDVAREYVEKRGERERETAGTAWTVARWGWGGWWSEAAGMGWGWGGWWWWWEDVRSRGGMDESLGVQ